ncbi:hypothetical protein BJI45_00765 [Limosilactobacillus reuteri]|nr:hypothetical protein BJI45_00765 [Limosilactobacillus reuteri]
MCHEPSIYSTVSKSTQKRWRRIFQASEKHNELALALAEVFVENLRSIDYQLHDIFNRFDVEI